MGNIGPFFGSKAYHSVPTSAWMDLYIHSSMYVLLNIVSNVIEGDVMIYVNFEILFSC
jgi:hypothetical protein